MAASGPQGQPQSLVKLLSIDGGGVRGLSALVLLEQIMDNANEYRRTMKLDPQEPWQMFDMICGTSTGGLIAIMLGRLRMSIEECMNAYKDLAEKAFDKKHIVSRSWAKLTVRQRFKTEPLEEAIRKTIGDDWQTMMLKEEDEDACKVFVVSHIGEIDQPVALRSYRNIRLPKRSFNAMHVWEACRATSAATTFFDPIVVDGTTYRDGGLYYNNPVQLLHNEASEIFRGREQMIISLGTGIASSKAYDPALLTIAESLAAIATETEVTANDFYRRNDGEAARTGRYFRFNTPEIGNVSMEEAKDLNRIRILTEQYLEGTETSKKTSWCAEQLVGVLKFYGTTMGTYNRNDVLQWISVVDMAEKHREFIDDWEQGTCTWFHSDSDFRRWTEGSIKTLWCRGMRGAGKTIVMATVFEYLKRLERKNTAILQIYLVNREQKQQSSIRIISALLRQLANQSEQLSAPLVEWYTQHSTANTQPSLKEYFFKVRSEVCHFQKVHILIDGLDECTDQTRLDLINLANQILEFHTDACLLVSSRHIPGIGSGLKDPVIVEMRVEPEDVRLYIKRCIARLASLQELTVTYPDLTEEIIKTISKNTEGMFLLVKIHVQLLEDSEKHTKSGFKLFLQTLPSALNETYEEVWRQIASRKASESALAKSALAWVSFARETLNTTVLQHALFAQGREDLDNVDEDELTSRDYILKICNGLLIWHEDSDTVGFVHYTAEEFFPPHLENEVPEVHALITKACMMYMSLPGIQPMTQYAATAWGYHAKLYEKRWQKSLDLVLQFLQNDDKVQRAIELLDHHHTSSSFESGCSAFYRGGNRFHLASFFGLLFVAQELLAVQPSILHESESQGISVLLWACYGRDYEMVKFLLENGADVTLKDMAGNTALTWALGKRSTFSNYRNIRIREASTDNIPSYTQKTEYITASQCGSVDGDPCLPAKFSEDARTAKTHITHIRATRNFAVRLIVPISIELESGDHSPFTPDAPLPLKTSLAIVNLLIHYAGSNINAYGPEQRTALSLAAENQQFDVVDTLLKADAEIESVDHDGMTPLLWNLVSPRRYLEMRDISIEGNIKVHLGFYIDIFIHAPGSAEAKAARTEKEDPQESMALRLLTSGVNLTDLDGRTALSFAAESAHVKLVEALIRRQADINIADCSGMTPLMYACKDFAPFSSQYTNISSSHAAVHVGAAVKIQGDLSIPLSWNDQRSIERRIAVVKMLVNAGADVACTDNQGSNAFGHAGWPELLDTLRTCSGNFTDHRFIPVRRAQGYHGGEYRDCRAAGHSSVHFGDYYGLGGKIFQERAKYWNISILNGTAHIGSRWTSKDVFDDYPT